MSYCNWCHLDSDSDEFCVWCKRPLSSGPSLFNLPKKNDIHFLAAEDDSSDIQVPVFAILGVLVFVAIAGFAWLNLRHNDQVAQAPAPVTDVGNLKPNQPRSVADLGPMRNSRFGGNSSSAIQVTTNRGVTVAEQTPASQRESNIAETWKNGIPFMRPVALSWFSDVPSDQPANTIYFESAKFQIQNDAKGVAQLTGDVVVVNDGTTGLKGGKLWLTIGSTKLTLHWFSGKIEDPLDLGLIDLPSKTFLDCHVYAEGFNKKMDISLKKTLGMDASVAGAPVYLDGEITSS